MIDCIGAVFVENNTDLSVSIRLGAFVTKTRYEKDMIDRIGAVFTKNDIDLS